MLNLKKNVSMKSMVIDMMLILRKAGSYKINCVIYMHFCPIYVVCHKKSHGDFKEIEDDCQEYYEIPMLFTVYHMNINCVSGLIILYLLSS